MNPTRSSQACNGTRRRLEHLLCDGCCVLLVRLLVRAVLLAELLLVTLVLVVHARLRGWAEARGGEERVEWCRFPPPFGQTERERERQRERERECV